MATGAALAFAAPVYMDGLAVVTVALWPGYLVAEADGELG
jgi:hypothetical protein